MKKDMDRPKPHQPPVIRINGEKIRAIREAKGLTQLYVATAVGVTTDTISRWENRRYPSIKKENALRLAEALETGIEALTEFDDEENQEAESDEGVRTARDTRTGGSAHAGKTGHALSKNALGAIAAAALGAFAILALLMWHAPWKAKSITDTSGRLSVFRILPGHTAPGQKFPVLLRIDTNIKDGSVLIKEIVPSGCKVEEIWPRPETIKSDKGVIQWIYRLKEAGFMYCYLVSTDPSLAMGTRLHFRGTATARSGQAESTTIEGNATVELTPFHWADSNSDGEIDDREILTVFDEMRWIQAVKKELETIEEIWAANGYQWDSDRKRFLPRK